MENALDSAAKHGEYYDRNSSEPSFVVGSKVLLFDPTTKKGKSATWMVKLGSPYIITDTKPGYRPNYRLKELKSGTRVIR